MSALPVLIVDDEPDICELLAMSLRRDNIDSEIAHDVATAREQLSNRRYALCLTDMRLPDGDGLQLIDFIQGLRQPVPVAMITAHGNMDTAIAALKKGAFDFLNKPIELDQLSALVQSALKLDAGATPVDSTLLNDRLSGSSADIARLRQLVHQVARSQAPVFIHGESGTGKEVVARLIHDNSVRSAGPFIPVNCGAIPGELVESEFFGHKKGSFTGASEDKAGLFQEASGGTLLLDEVADLPLPMQVKLLRAIQEKAVRPVGGNREVPVDVRILSATHKNLYQLIDAEQFRSDLFYRINVIEVRVPPLRERSEDIPALCTQLLAKIAAEQSIDTPEISAAAMDRLCSYTFPGNIRELENILERSLALSGGRRIDGDDLQFGPGAQAEPKTSAPQAGPQAAVEPQAAAGRPQSQSLDDYLQGIERDEITQALEACRWNKTEAARYLGISFRSLRYRMKKLDMDT